MNNLLADLIPYPNQQDTYKFQGKIQSFPESEHARMAILYMAFGVIPGHLCRDKREQSSNASALVQGSEGGELSPSTVHVYR